MNKFARVSRGLQKGFGGGLHRLLDGALYLIPLFVVAGIFDYRFHGYFWNGLSALRPLGGIAMFDLFSVASLFVWILLGLYLLTALFVKEVRPRARFRWIYIVIGMIVAGLVVSRVAYVPLEPVIRSYWFQAYINYVSPILMGLVVLFSAGSGGDNSARFLKRFKMSWMIVFSLFGAAILFEYFTGLFPGGTGDFLERLAWPYINPLGEMEAESANWLSFLFGPMVILSFIGLFKKVISRDSNWKSLISVELVCAVISGLILTLTKSYTGIGVVGLILIGILFVWLPVRLRKYAVIGVALMAVVFVATQYNTRKFQILIGNDSQETSLNRRAQIYTLNYEAFKEYPLEGIGPGNYQAFFRENVDRYLPDNDIPEIEIPPHPHNLVMFWWSDLGVFGFLAAVMIYVMVLLGISRKTGGSRKKRNAYLFVVLYFLGHGLLDLPYAMEENSLMFWALLMMAIASEDVI
jgi:hypothetical protein